MLSLETIGKLRENISRKMTTRIRPETASSQEIHILVCGGTGCESNKSDTIAKCLIEGIEQRAIEDRVKVIKTGCFGFCEQGPVVKFMPERVFYVRVTPRDTEEILEEHLMKGKWLERLLVTEQKGVKKVVDEINFYKKQQRIVLRNCGVINPEEIDEYIGNGGYLALERVLRGMSQEHVIRELKTSGLRGRGGAGYPTWQKWTFARNAGAERKYIVCNADEGDPGAYMDRSILEGDPHAVIEALIIAGYTIGASKGYFYLRAEYGLAIERVRRAIDQAYQYGILGDHILGTDLCFDLDIRLGAGAFVCGEETALLASVEGKRGTPRPRPPYPSVSGLFEMPTVINNVETLANIPSILVRGGNWFAGIGTENSKGTKVFALTGKIKTSGLVEVPMGTTIREIVYDIGGGIAVDKRAKAVQTGGPSGGVIPEKYFDTPVDYENLTVLGSMMGSGGMIVIDEDDDIVELAKFYLGFCVDESCGKCAPCRIGGYQMLQIFNRLSRKRGKPEDLKKLKDIALAMQKGSLCGLGQTASNPVISSLRYFPQEYESKIKT